jgi:AraC family transcriptional regulator
VLLEVGLHELMCPSGPAIRAAECLKVAADCAVCDSGDMTNLAGGPGRLLSDSTGLGWRSAGAGAFADPPQLDDFSAPPAAGLALVLVTAGRYRIESRDGQLRRRADFGPGSVAVTAPGRGSVFRWRSSGPDPLESFHLHVAPPAVHETLDTFGVPHDRLAGLDALSLDEPYVAASLTALHQALGQRAAGLYADTVATSIVVHLVHHRLAGAAPRAGFTGGPGTLGARDLRRVTDYMHAHLGEDIDLATLAGLVNVSKYHFLRMFTRATGRTPHRHLTAVRMQRAAELLRTSDLSVQQVAAVCGYRSPSRFATAFQKQYAVPPSRYRR